MASPRRQRLRAKHERLLQRSELLRDRLALRAQVLHTPLAVADQLIEGVHWLRRNPAWPVGVGVGLMVVRPRLVWRWAGRGLFAWRLWRRLAPLSRWAQRVL